MFNTLKNNKVFIAVGIVWLFHISAIIGISLGYKDWFINKTPLNLSLCLLLFILAYPIHQKKQGIAFLIFFVGGMFAEWLGVNYGVIFGEYTYGSNFGPKLDGVPYLIGTYWAILTFISYSITDFLKLRTGFKIVLAAVLMVVLDYFMEYSAHSFDFWTFEGNLASLENYITWFILALIFQIILASLRIKGNRFFSLNLYLAQFIFFFYFYF